MALRMINFKKRCRECGGKVRLVNVIWVNKFKTPEASEYDQCVSRRKVLLGIEPKKVAREVMCTRCGQRYPIIRVSARQYAKEQATLTNVNEPKKVTKKASENKNNGLVIFIKLLIVAAILLALAYLAYRFRATIVSHFESLAPIFEKAEKVVATLKDIWGKLVHLYQKIAGFIKR